MLAARQPPLALAQLSQAQREILLDFALSEGAAGLPREFLAAVLPADWKRLIHTHLYVRYAGPAPDHCRIKAFAERWIYSRRLGIAP